LICVNLARLQHNFSAEPEGYEKVEKALPAAQLAALQPTFCPLEYSAMLNAGLIIVQFYRERAAILARRHEITYPEQLERVMRDRMETLRNALEP
jgi:hypothetical protein